ncbi:efflux RND transporter permease subunit [Bacillus sp. mrc49]|uniref:efflux RND transporter permease subunit n=1 Tax=Bacillus sp. mrc49 TaxID=2054913 RepID=UPI000C27730D|nr:efflux RND transporter permease subunit [Bacillus sp. mrc49]PJN91112.1 AcrB/AcrD/AcrF family protein [Bacillus sp. mrc49]
MEFLTKWSFKNKAAVSLVTIFILMIGIISYFKLPMEFLPSADNPQVTIITMGQGTDSKTMEAQVTEPVESAVTGVKGKSAMYSTTGDGFSKIDLTFESGSDMKQAKLDVQEALSSVALPQSMTKPTVTQLNTSMIPISFIAVTFKDGLTAESLDLTKKELEPLYKDIKGVSDVQTFGISQSVLSVKVDNEQLSKKNVSIQNVMSVLNGQDAALAVGEKVIDGKTSNIKVIGDVTSIEKVKALKVTSDVTLGEIAKVAEAKDGNLISRFNGKESIDISIIKDSQSNAVTISKEVEKVTKEINEKYKEQKSTVYLSTADMVETSVHSMVKEVLLGALFATIVIMVFLRNVRSTFITIVSIPLSLGFTLFLLSLSGVTLNILTLGGVAVAIGRLVDDSIVVIENIFRKMQQEKISVQMVMDAVKEVGVAITASTLTTVAVFLPVALLNGGLQEFLLPFALTVTYSLLASLIVALTVVPLMSAGLLKRAKLPKHRPAKHFTKLVTWSLNHKWVVLIIALLLFVGSIGTYFTMPKGAIDNSSADYVSVTLTYPNDEPFDQVKGKAIELEEKMRDLSEVDNVFMQLGNSAEAAQYGAVTSPTEATFGILVKDEANMDAILEEIDKQKENYPEAKLTASASSFMMGASKTNITIDVIGKNVGDLERTANKIKGNIQEIKGIEDVATNQDEKKTIYSFKVDPAKGNAEQIGQQLGVMLNRTPIGNMKLADKQTPVILEPILDPKNPNDLKNIPIMTDGGLVPVSKVASLTSEESATTQFHKDGETYLRLTATVDPAKLSDISNKVNAEIFGDKETKGLNIPKDVDIYVGGASAQQTDDFSDLFLTMLLSIGIVFLIMVITFKSMKAPIAILFSLPFAAIGAVLGLVISRISVDITALLGALMLIGIVVTNAIVLLDRVRQNEDSMIIRDAIIEATATRFRPIIMTAVATICAMLPLLYKKAETGSLVSQSLAIVVIGGLAVSTLLTLIVIPCIYELLYFKKSKKQRMNKNEPVSESAEM